MARFRSLFLATTCALTLTATPVLANPLQDWVGRLLEWSRRRPTASPTVTVTGFVPPAAGLPGNREGGATRGAVCPVSSKPLTALIPTRHLGLTAAARPSFFFYLPPVEGRTVEFVLMDSRGAEVFTYTGRAQQSGIVRLDLPENAPALQVGELYQWYFSVVCDPQDRTADLYVRGSVQRVALPASFQQQLQRVPRNEHPYIYASAGLWHETLAALLDLRQSQPQNGQLMADWQSLLQIEGLGKVAQEPLAGKL
ncbi:MAG: DUF928 domain-containing protein [Gloeomargarita sp. SKYBB_i_bin120]|nr:DUF928 domain-containing protein [Gloeomargarita sp. SKYG98]MCS7292102.1 DUF928 domain-containing protein [Gloeomargarita sp. SKYB120]MDW8177662.1 DUF928 domain-containing protein [Gloeomargarita sp. SKYBB_i_bin120]